MGCEQWAMGIIIITGTPGTGKTLIARALAKKIWYKLIEIKKIVDEHKIDKKFCAHCKLSNLQYKDKGLYKIYKGERLVDLKRLKKATMKKIRVLESKNIIIESHLTCEMRLPAQFVFVLRCAPDILKRRLQRRKYPKQKREENVLAEMLDYCTLLVRKNFKGKQIIEIDTSKRSINNCVREIINVIKGKKKKIDNVNYSKELEKFTKEVN